MKIIQNESFANFIYSAYQNMNDYEKSGRYYHTLTRNDNKPIVVHNSTYQCTFVIEGSGIITANNKEYILKKNDIILLPPKTTHSFAAHTENLILFHIHIPDEGRDNDRTIVCGDDYNRYVEGGQ